MVKRDLLEGWQRAAVERGDEGGAAGVGDPGEVEVEPLELRQPPSRRRRRTCQQPRRHEGGETLVAERVAMAGRHAAREVCARFIKINSSFTMIVHGQEKCILYFRGHRPGRGRVGIRLLDGLESCYIVLHGSSHFGFGPELRSCWARFEQVQSL